MSDVFLALAVIVILAIFTMTVFVVAAGMLG